MKFLRSSLFLLVLALIGGAYLFFAERGPTPREGALTLLRVPKEEIHSVEFLPSGLNLRRVGVLWRIADKKSGLDAPADPDATRKLLDALQLVQSIARVENPGKLAVYGLENPRAQLRANGQTLEFGTAPRFDAHRVYARSKAGIALVNSQLFEFSRQSFGGWRDNAIWRGDPEKIARIALQTSSLRAVLIKRDANWQFEKPIRARADANAIAGAFRGLQTARITKRLDESGANLHKWGLDQPRAVFSLNEYVHGAANTGFKLEVGIACNGGFAARVSDARAIFLLPSATYATWNRPLQVWRDPKITIFDASSVAKIEITSRGAQRVLEGQDDNWRLQGGQSSLEARGAALDLLDFLGALRAQGFVDSPKRAVTFGFDNPTLSIKIVTQTGETISKTRFARARGQLYAQNIGINTEQSAVGTVFVLSGSALAPIQGALDKIFPQPLVSRLKNDTIQQ